MYFVTAVSCVIPSTVVCLGPLSAQSILRNEYKPAVVTSFSLKYLVPTGDLNSGPLAPTVLVEGTAANLIIELCVCVCVCVRSMAW